MDASPPVTVLLPTRRWTTACSEVAAQLRPRDELVVVCDEPDDPVAVRADEHPDGVAVVVAGRPSGCSGKANAIAAGMEAASHDRVVWTDDDFHHPPDWLARLAADYDRHGPVTEVPFFVGRDPLALALEPTYAVGGTLATFLGDIAWGGAVLFERTDLDEPALLADLRRSMSDDGVLTESLDVTAVRRTRRVAAGGTVRATLERHVRFTKIVRYHDPAGFAGMGVVTTLATIAALVFPLPALIVLTLVQAGIYAAFGVRRWTFLLAYPATLAQGPLLLYGLARRTVVWGDRRYRWRGKYGVEVVD